MRFTDAENFVHHPTPYASSFQALALYRLPSVVRKVVDRISVIFYYQWYNLGARLCRLRVKAVLMGCYLLERLLTYLGQVSQSETVKSILRKLSLVC